MSFADMSIDAFTLELASKASVPGGGGAAALTGALGAALCSMVGNLTVGRKKYADVEADVYAMLAKAEKLQGKFLRLIDKDAELFAPLAKAYSLPKDDPESAKILEAATIGACAAPMEMMRCCRDGIELLEEMLEKGSQTMVSDVGCGALCCFAALEGAAMNVFVNTKSMRDRNAAAALDAEADALLDAYGPRAMKVAGEVKRRLRQGA